MFIASIRHYYIIKAARSKATRCCAIHAPWNWCALRSAFIHKIIFVY